MLVVAAEDYKGVSPNVTTAGYDTAPRYLDTYKTALEGLGYEVATFDVDNPPPTGGTPNGVVYPQIKYPTTSACSRTSTRSSTSPATTSSRRTSPTRPRSA